MVRVGRALSFIILALSSQHGFLQTPPFSCAFFLSPSNVGQKHVDHGYGRHRSCARARDSARIGGSRRTNVDAVFDSTRFSSETTATADDSKAEVSRVEGKGVGVDRVRLAEGIAREFDAQLGKVREGFEGRLARERDLHRYELAKQRVELLEGMVPLSAHEAIVESYENQSKKSIVQVAASSAAGLKAATNDFAKRHEEMRLQLEAKDDDLGKASAGLRDMSDSLSGLKRDLHLLRTALSSHTARAEASRNELAREIRKNEVEPETKRADEAEAGLSELRASAHNWLATAHAIKLDAAAEARATGYLQGQADGRSDAYADSLKTELSLRVELEGLRDEFWEHRSCARGERLALTNAVAKATGDAYTMVTSAAAAGAAALEASRDNWKAEGHAEGFVEGFAAGETRSLAKGFEKGVAEGHNRGFSEGLVAGRADGIETGRAEGLELGRTSEAVSSPLQAAAWDKGAAGVRGKVVVRERGVEAAASSAERELREAFAAYVISAHDQKLECAKSERAASDRMARGLEEELAAARGVLAQVLQERISELEAKRDEALREVDTPISLPDAETEQHLPSKQFLQAPSWLEAAAAVGGQGSNPAFWQECGGGQL